MLWVEASFYLLFFNFFFFQNKSKTAVLKAEPRGQWIATRRLATKESCMICDSH